MKIISVVFHPLLMATYLSAILFTKTPELFPRVMPQIVPEFVLVVFITTCLMPALSLLLLRTFSFITNLELTQRSERIRPFIFIAFYYGASSYLFSDKLEMGPVFMTVMISVSILILILLIITTWFKVSIHSAAIWSGVGFLTALVLHLGVIIGWYYFGFILAAGLTSSSRLYLGYHKPKEVWSGAILGFIYSYLTIVLFL
ncbi:phosphatase PAP2 family protein [Ekhidna sp.]|uniref:phosphatase PAP2 family protein n=1 Tax=Ekhidna sp. TaxID=2608089 RepID=UPI0032EA9994